MPIDIDQAAPDVGDGELNSPIASAAARAASDHSTDFRVQRRLIPRMCSNRDFSISPLHSKVAQGPLWNILVSTRYEFGERNGL